MNRSHGGGWCLNGLDTEAFLCGLFCSSLDLVVVDVEYPLCPEFQDLVQVLDEFDARKWRHAFHRLHSQMKGVDPR
jgi:acetyl esterase/lipase